MPSTDQTTHPGASDHASGQGPDSGPGPGPKPDRTGQAAPPSSAKQASKQASGADTEKTPVSFTGERPGWGEGFEYDYARHLAAYRHVATLATNCRVLDAGCGEGFGTHTLAATAREVVGIDYSADAIAECRRLWSDSTRPNLRFERVDLTDAGNFTERFELVLNFQVLEHIHDSRAFLTALRDRLTPDGLLVLTTPNRLRTISENPYHVREYTAGELHAELLAVFPEVTIQGIHGNSKVERFEEGRAQAVRRILRLDPLGIRNLLPRAVVEFAFAKLARLVRKQASAPGEASIVASDFSVSRHNVDNALDLVAVCSGGVPSARGGASTRGAASTSAITSTRGAASAR